MSDLSVSWQKILHDAIHTPGTISEAYSRFHNYSVGNQLLALMQCNARSLQPGSRRVRLSSQAPRSNAGAAAFPATAESAR